MYNIRILYIMNSIRIAYNYNVLYTYCTGFTSVSPNLCYFNSA